MSQSESSSFEKKSNTSSQADVPQKMRREAVRIQPLLMLVIIVLMVSHNPFAGPNVANGQASIYPAFVDGVFTLGTASQTDPNPYDLGFTLLESRPSASKTIFLDFNGHRSVGNLWNHDVNFIPYDLDMMPFDPVLGQPFPFFIAEELSNIQNIWQAVAEDFAPFDVNVVTSTNIFVGPTSADLIRSGFSDQNFGIRVVIGAEPPGFQGSPGVSMMDTFGVPTDTPVFVYFRDVFDNILDNDTIGITIAHEVGHALGISPKGLGNFVDHPGTGEGEVTSWGPINGRPAGNNLVQWTDGSYENATNTEADYDIITRDSNGIDFRLDDFGDTIGTATPIDFFNGEVFQWGFIGDQFDKDVFRFETGFGDVVISINPFAGSENLDIRATIFDSVGNVIDVRDPTDNTWANFIRSLEDGVYFLEIDGTGLEGRYTDYGSVGFYTIRADLVELPTNQIGESGVIDNLNHNWQTITLSQTYVEPVVVFGPPTDNGNNPVTIRLRNVTSDSFEVRIQEYSYLDVVHIDETVGYVVVEAGTYELTDGTTIHAARETIDHNWESVDISETFSETPIILAQVETINDFEPVTVRVRNVTDNGFQFRLQEEQFNDIFSGGTSNGPLQVLGHRPETVGYIAIEPDDGLLGNGVSYETTSTGVNVTDQLFGFGYGVRFEETPVLLAGMQTTNGGDTANVRLSLLTPFSAQIFIEEEQSLDLELDHAPEQVGVFALGVGPLLAVDADDGGFDFLTGPKSGLGPEPEEADSLQESPQLQQLNNSNSRFRLNNNR